MSDFLVTGATGFVGSWLTRRLLEDGHHVRVLCRNPKGLDQDLQGRCEVFKGDITQLESLVEASRNVSRIYHLAGLVAYSEDQRPAMERVNVQGTRLVIESCVRNRVSELVYMSSVVAIGASHKPLVLNEESPYTISDLNLGYFETKREAEEVVMEAHRSGKIKAFIINPSTIYGPGDFKKGSRKMQLKAARGKLPLYTKGGVSVVSIEDVVEGALRVTEKGRAGERYILSGDNITIKELFDKITGEMNSKAPWICVPTPVVRLMGKVGLMSRESSYTSTMYHWFDNGKAREELGLNFRSSDEAIKASTQWLKDHKDEV